MTARREIRQRCRFAGPDCGQRARGGARGIEGGTSERACRVGGGPDLRRGALSDWTERPHDQAGWDVRRPGPGPGTRGTDARLGAKARLRVARLRRTRRNRRRARFGSASQPCACLATQEGDTGRERATPPRRRERLYPFHSEAILSRRGPGFVLAQSRTSEPEAAGDLIWRATSTCAGQVQCPCDVNVCPSSY